METRTNGIWERWPVHGLSLTDHRGRCRPFPVFLLCGACLAGCLQHRTSWLSPETPRTAAPSELAPAVELAHEKTGAAGDREAVEGAVAAWHRVLEIEPANLEALVRAGDLELLLGAGYATSRREQREHYLESMRWNERALYTLPAFRARVDAGEPLWTAVDAVGNEGMEPMIKWVTAVFYLYGNTLSSLGKVLNVRWLNRSRRVMERMSAIDPDWGEGVLRFSWGIFYVALPPVAGGDRAKAAQEIERALKLGPDWLLFRWGRGRYLHYETGNRTGFVDDLEWVVAQDPRQASGPYAWNVYLQRDARRLLDAVDELFPSR